MAFDPDNWKIDYTFADRDEQTSPMTINLGSALAFLDVETKAGAIAALAGALSTGVIRQYTVSRTYTDLAAPAPSPESNVQDKGYFSWRLADKRQTSFSLPSIDPSRLVPGAPLIDQEDVGVANLIAAILLDGTDRIGVDIVSLIKAVRSSVKSNPRI